MAQPRAAPSGDSFGLEPDGTVLPDDFPVQRAVLDDVLGQRVDEVEVDDLPGRIEVVRSPVPTERAGRDFAARAPTREFMSAITT